jgi:hypothetical protein
MGAVVRIRMGWDGGIGVTLCRIGMLLARRWGERGEIQSARRLVESAATMGFWGQWCVVCGGP